MFKVANVVYPMGTVIVVPFVLPKIYAQDTKPCEKCCMKRLPKAHELPLYEIQDASAEKTPIIQEPGSLERGIAVVHKQVSKYFSALDVFWNQTLEIYNTGVAHSKSTYDYIRQEENIAPRALTIAAGGLTGLLIAARRGIFKKIVYSSIGLGAVASACYPNEAKDYMQQGYNIAFSKTNSVLKEHAGYDIEKIKTDAKDKVGSFKDSISFQNVSNSAKEMFSKIYPVEKMAKNKTGSAHQLEDHGQSNPKDADLYTTRS